MIQVQIHPGVSLSRVSLVPNVRRLFEGAGLRGEGIYESNYAFEGKGAHCTGKTTLMGRFPEYVLSLEEERYPGRDGTVYAPLMRFSQGCSKRLKLLRRSYHNKDHEFVEGFGLSVEGHYNASLVIPEHLEELLSRCRRMSDMVSCLDSNPALKTGFEAGEEIIRIKKQSEGIVDEGEEKKLVLVRPLSPRDEDRLRYLKSIYRAACKIVANSRTVSELMDFVANRE